MSPELRPCSRSSCSFNFVSPSFSLNAQTRQRNRPTRRRKVARRHLHESRPRRDFPDPTVIRASDGFFYAYATQALVAGKTFNIQVARSRDLVRWEALGDALPVKPAWANETQKFWAPHVSQHGDTFYLYYSADPNTLTGLCLAVATAKQPQGPFTDIGKPLKCGKSFVNIDPMAYDDPLTGKRLLYWGSGFEPLRVQELAADRVSFKRGSVAREVVSPIKTEDPANYQRLIEGAWVTHRAGFYYLYFSGDNCCGDKAHYAVMVARSRSLSGRSNVGRYGNRKAGPRTQPALHRARPQLRHRDAAGDDGSSITRLTPTSATWKPSRATGMCAASCFGSPSLSKGLAARPSGAALRRSRSPRPPSDCALN